MAYFFTTNALGSGVRIALFPFWVNHDAIDVKVNRLCL